MLQQWLARIQSRPKTTLAVCALLLAVQVGPWWYSSIDSASYLSMAGSIARGTGPTNFGSRLLWYSPGYPALISPLFLLDDRPFFAIAILQWLLAVGLLVGVYQGARAVAPEAAVWIAALTVVNHGLWIHVRRPLSEVAFLCLLVWAVNCLRRLPGVPRTLFLARLFRAAALTALLCVIRPVGVMIVPAFIVWAALEARVSKWSWPRALISSAVIAAAAGTPVALFVTHERTMAAKLGGRSYADEFHEAAQSPLESYSRGLQLSISDIGRVCLPGLFKSHGRPGDWTDPNMLIHTPFFALVVCGWLRWQRKANDLLAWYVPFYVLLIAAHAMDTGARLLLPLLPALFVCAWFALERIGNVRQAVAAACLILQAAVGGAYWLAVDLPRARYFHRQWPAVEELAAPIRAGAPAAVDADSPTDLRLMLELALDRPVAVRTDRR